MGKALSACANRNGGPPTSASTSKPPQIKREALYSTDDTRKRLRFHNLRGTGLTWMAIRGDDPLKIQQRAGHRTFKMTQKYIRTAVAVGEDIGAVFPPLPENLVAGRYRQEYRSSDLQLFGTIVKVPSAPKARE